MGFLKQDTPVVDYAEWSTGTRAEKIVPMARHWAEAGDVPRALDAAVTAGTVAERAGSNADEGET